MIGIRKLTPEELVESHIDTAAFNKVITGACCACAEVAKSKGFNIDMPRGDKEKANLVMAEMIALMHSELSEALEAIRNGNPKDDKIDVDSLTTELADTVIRIFHFAGRFYLPLGNAIRLKMRHNLTRPYKHGKEF